MGFENVIAFIFLFYLRGQLKKREVPEKWRKPINYGLIIVVILAILAGSFDNNLLIKFFSILLISYIVYNIFTHPEFSGTKSLVYAALPLIAVSLIRDIFELAMPELFKTWDKVFDVASFFAFIWLVAMYIIYRKQKKALLAEKVKALEREKEFRITQSIKAQLEIDVAERTSDLVKQKEELEKTLTELKSTQSQLIHAEKMASLGELTAGIAHEIQNPLNFVNNFSEVSEELLQELQEELDKGDLEEAKAISRDVIENLKKIHHHGKRADGIVKGMLQHSRTGSGQKEPTDINELADEFLRLSYHGLRAKDKSFNADFKMDFDPTLPKVNIVPQDIGRVFLNLINNAFYACSQSSKVSKPLEDFRPLVTVSTKNIGNTVQITVSDNGPGIPEDIREKIYQPFFTTKPTGQGTGLGLSLSYEIIKAHGGGINIKSENGNGTQFIIELPI